MIGLLIEILHYYKRRLRFLGLEDYNFASDLNIPKLFELRFLGLEDYRMIRPMPILLGNPDLKILKSYKS